MELPAQLTGQLVTHPLGGAEDDDPGTRRLGSQDLHQLGQLLVHAEYLQDAEQLSASCRK